MTHYHTSALAEIACASCMLQCAECHQPRALITDDCPDCEASGLVTRIERDQLAATADTWQHRGRP